MDLHDIIVQAPGRTCLFGDHQDYLGLPVIACAIDRHISLRAKKNTRNVLFIDKPDIGEQRTIDLRSVGRSAEKGDHFMAALQILETHGCVPGHGYDITLSGNIAINAGTSSSSAVIMSWIQFLVTAFGCDEPITNEFISRMAYEAEVKYHGFPGGKMDQYTIGIGNTIFLETGNDFSYQNINIKLPGLILGVSGIPKDTTGLLKELKSKALLSIKKIKEFDNSFEIKKVKKSDLKKYDNYIP
ncbi:MAG: galactokinase, partial [Flavobacteriia bacterium]